MKRIRSFIAKLICLTLVFVLLAWTFLFGSSVRERRQAEALLAAFQSMKTGSTTLNEVQPILAAYSVSNLAGPSCGGHPASKGYSISLADKKLFALETRLPFLRFLGLSPWGAGADLFFNEGKLCHLRFSVGTEITILDHTRGVVNMAAEESTPGREMLISSGGPPVNRILVVTLPGNPTPAQHSHAFAFHLSCLTQLGGCRDICQLLPLKPIWEDRVSYEPTQNIVIPQAVLENSYCGSK